MKKIIFLLSFSSLFFFGCDKVDNPIQAFTIVTPPSDTVRKIFIEDLTGHMCQNCPKAAHRLDSLKAAFPGRVIGMAVHIDYFANPYPINPMPSGSLPGTFTEDFRTPENADYDNIFHMVGNWGYPNGIINRAPDPIGLAIPTEIGNWAAATATLISDSMTAYLKINPSYNSSTRQLNIDVTGEFLCDTTGSYNIALYLVEDGLTGSQVDLATPGGIDNNYIFNSVLRGCINSPGTISGQPISTPSTITGHTPITYSSPAFTVSSNYNAANCKIIAILINNADRGVLQAAECNLY